MVNVQRATDMHQIFREMLHFRTYLAELHRLVVLIRWPRSLTWCLRKDRNRSHLRHPVQVYRLVLTLPDMRLTAMSEHQHMRQVRRPHNQMDIRHPEHTA